MQHNSFAKFPFYSKMGANNITGLDLFIFLVKATIKRLFCVLKQQILRFTI